MLESSDNVTVIRGKLLLYTIVALVIGILIQFGGMALVGDSGTATSLIQVLSILGSLMAIVGSIWLMVTKSAAWKKLVAIVCILVALAMIVLDVYVMILSNIDWG